MENKQTMSDAARQARNEYMRQYRRELTEDQKEQRREYYRKWRAANKDKVQANQENYWMRKAEKMKAK